MKWVGVSMRIVQADGYIEPRDAISHDWLRLLLRYRVAPLLLPNLPELLPILLARVPLDAVLLTNGNDLATTSGAAPSSTGAAPGRDTTERRLLDHAVAENIPVLGVCRGLQMINSYFGGQLLRDLTDLSGSPRAHVACTHTVTLTESKYRERLGVDTVQVNSYHGQAVQRPGLAHELRAFALSDDGLVEGLFHPGLPIVGMQWHPERPNPARVLDETILGDWLER